MGFFNKIKDILFEEVEEDEVKPTSKAEAPKEIKKPIAKKIEPQRSPEPQIEREVPKPAPEPLYREPVKEQQNDTLNERDLFKQENTFPFPEFDEEEFTNSISRMQKPKPSTNVLEYEKKKKIEKKYDLGRYERTEKTEVVEKKKFRPSPIISPVYGILNEDYKPEDIKDKTDANNTLDFNSVRKKAFETEKLIETEPVAPKTTYYEESVTVKLKEPEEERVQKVKTIDELLEDTADMTIDVEKTPKEEYNKLDDDLEDFEIPAPKKVVEEKEDNDDTLETDLFDLIDSMYDNREDGED